jgi:hypothetical protein
VDNFGDVYGQIKKIRNWLRSRALRVFTSPSEFHGASMPSTSPPLIPKPETRYRNESGALKDRPLLEMMEPIDNAVYRNWYKITVSRASHRRRGRLSHVSTPGNRSTICAARRRSISTRRSCSSCKMRSPSRRASARWVACHLRAPALSPALCDRLACHPSRDM